ncbi:hypothetical protein [Natrinema salinisoli]|nr:hypothetical protein [Natrinema salinisoli]
MTGHRDESPKRCPECDAMLVERDPLMGWWLCGDCEIGVTDDGTVVP